MVYISQYLFSYTYLATMYSSVLPINITLPHMCSNMRNRLLPNFFQAKKLYYEFFKPCTNCTVTCFQLRQSKNISTNNQNYSNDDKNEKTKSHNLAGSISARHKVFQDQDGEIILDISERQEAINLEDLRIEGDYRDPYEGINLERGTNGVFDIDELVLLLQKDNAKDIFVASVPSQLSYVDYIVIVTSKSNKHMKALAAFVRKVYKLKKHKMDEVPRIEGKNSKNWIAIDLGNIALHIFSQSTRVLYDLETLWSVGPEYDDSSKSDAKDIMEQYNAFLSDLEPIENDKKDNKVYEKL